MRLRSRVQLAEQTIRETATNIITQFLMEQGKTRHDARETACQQVQNSPLSLLKKIMAGRQ